MLFRSRVNASGWSDGSQFHQEFVNVHHFHSEVGGGVQLRVGVGIAGLVQFFGDVSIVFQHRAAAGDVDNDGIQLLSVECCGVLLHQRDCWLGGTRVVVDGAAAGLGRGDHDVAAILLQHSSGGPVDMPEHGISDTTDKQSYCCPTFSNSGKKSGQGGLAGLQSG